MECNKNMSLIFSIKNSSKNNYSIFDYSYLQNFLFYPFSSIFDILRSIINIKNY